MILARCPACSTIFRVRQEQLDARGGRVRCGHCKQAFNALEHRVEEPATAPANPPAVSTVEAVAAAGAAASLFVLEEKAKPQHAESSAHPKTAVASVAPTESDAVAEVAPAENEAAPNVIELPAAAEAPVEESSQPAAEPAPAEPTASAEEPHQSEHADALTVAVDAAPDAEDSPSEGSDVVAEQETAEPVAETFTPDSAESTDEEPSPAEASPVEPVAAEATPEPAPVEEATPEPASAEPEAVDEPARHAAAESSEPASEAAADTAESPAALAGAPEFVLIADDGEQAAEPMPAAPEAVTVSSTESSVETTAEAAVPPFEDIDIDAEWPPGAPAPLSAVAEESPASPDETPPTVALEPANADSVPVDFDALLHKRDGAENGEEALVSPPGDQPWPASEEPAAMLAQSMQAASADAAPAPLEIQPEDSDETHEEPIARVVSPDSGQGGTIVTTPEEKDFDLPPLEMEEAPPEPASPWRQAAWAATATLLLLGLLAQAVIVFRAELVESAPQTRPFMESLCAALGCELPLPRDSAKIAIESSDIQPDATREAFFTLYATLRNRADYPLAYPHLEITLTDARDKALVRKVLEPAQWLPADAPKDAFPAKREIATKISFEAPGVAAAGYLVYAFYP